MKNLSYLELAYRLAGMRKQLAEELELPGALNITIKCLPEKTVVDVSFKHARKGTKVSGGFELSELHYQMLIAEFKGLETIAQQIRQAIPDTKSKNENE